jgi:NADH dehydrogenase
MKVALFGGTGFLGSYIIDELIQQEYYINIFARQKEDTVIATNSLYANIIYANIEDDIQVENIIRDCDIVIYTLGIKKETNQYSFKNINFDISKRCIDISKKLKIKRFLMISSNNASINGTSYQRSKFLAEEYLKNSGINYTIFRASILFGQPKDMYHQDFCTNICNNLIRSPFPIPSLFNGFKFYQAGHFELSPVYVKDVAKAIILSIKDERCINKIYPMCGRNFTYNEVVQRLSYVIHKENKWLIPIPTSLAKLIANIFEKFDFFHTSKDNITILTQGNICANDKEENIFDILKITKKPFSILNLEYLNKIKN